MRGMRSERMLKLYVLRGWWCYGLCRHREEELVVMKRTPFLLSSRWRSCNPNFEYVLDSGERLEILRFSAQCWMVVMLRESVVRIRLQEVN